MKTRLITVIMLLCFGLPLAAQQSDFEIKQQFDAKYKSLLRQIETATSVQDCAELQVSMDALENEFKEHKDFLDKAYVENNFEQHFKTVKGNLLVRQNDLGIIQEQVVKIAELETMVRELSGKVEQLTSQNETLTKDIAALKAAKAQDIAAIDSLNKMVSQLRQNIADRDRMIFAMVDSIFMQYDKNVDGLADVSKKKLMSKLDRNNILTGIKKSILDNMTFLENTTLNGKDLAAIVNQQKKFASQWKGLGPKLTTLYVAQKDRAKELETINGMLGEWGTRVDGLFWKALNDVFARGGFVMKEFTNGADFHAGVMAFVNGEIMKAPDAKDESAKRYQKFVDSLWNTEMVKNWNPVLKENAIVAEAQFTEIQTALNMWGEATKKSYTWLYIVIPVVILGGMIFVFMRMKKTKPAA